MDSQNNISEFIQAHTAVPVGMMFYTSSDAVKEDADLTGYVSVIRKAWEEMKLDGVLCLDGRPVLYCKEYARPFSVKERIHLQKLFWNQGVANILILADPVSVYIYSGLALPQGKSPDDEDGKNETALVETLAHADYVARIQSFFHGLATGHYYEKKQAYFDPEQTVDAWLLGNLTDLRKELTEGENKLGIKDAHAFIGRVLFLCYLLDRGIVSIGKTGPKKTGTMLLSEILEKKSPEAQADFLYDGLFTDLKKRFNGNMFDQDIEKEKSRIRPEHMKKLILFLGGHNVGSGQRSLGFWAYDFRMIPVEIISYIYQDFLSRENPEDQRKKGAFYTPRFLAEMLADVAMQDEPDAYERSYLDPSCGSGIFLVILFNRLANHWLFRQKNISYKDKAKALKKILSRQICGVDESETACRIACFSLYLAYLDFFEPPDIIEHMKKTGEPLPKLLDYGNHPNRPAADIPVIHQADFLAEETLGGKKFDCIIGNPPWEGRGSKQLAQKFMGKTPHLLRNNGTGCLLLPTKILQNQTDAFQAGWLSSVTLEKVIQLADYRHLLFENAKTPAFIARFMNKTPIVNQHTVEYVAPKFNRNGLRKGLIIVNPASRTWIPLSDVISATQTKTAPLVWKRRLWGTQRDQKLLDLLQYLPPLSDLAGSPKEGKRWIKGQGFQPFYPEKAKNNPNYPKAKKNPWNPDSLFLRAEQKFGFFLFQHDSIFLGKRLEEIKASKKNLRWLPDKKIFKSPMILVSQGFTKIAYCDFDVLFQHSLQSIAGPKKDSNLLMFLAAYLRSNLAKYFLFHTSANWGSERDKVHLSELLRVPFPLPGNEFISPDAEQIIDQVAGKLNQLRNDLQKNYKDLKTNKKNLSLFD
ncbi:MAG: N-6 DNA methylase, partial [Desulfococcaceae bacterium]|nr:N-6 DNA methylase [Desulfococcaceae bacterium]